MTIPYCMHLSYLIQKIRCNVDVDPPLQQPKYTSFDNHTLRHMQYIMDAQGNWVKKLDKKPEQSELERQPKEALKASIQDPPPPPLALPDTYFVLLDELASLR